MPRWQQEAPSIGFEGYAALATSSADPLTSIGFESKLKTVVMKCIADPGVPHAIGSQANVVLSPDFLVLKGEDLAQLVAKIPGQGIDFSSLFYILDDDG